MGNSVESKLWQEMPHLFSWSALPMLIGYYRSNLAELLFKSKSNQMFCKASHEQFLFCTERAPTLSDANLAQKQPGSGDGLSFGQLSIPMADSCTCLLFT